MSIGDFVKAEVFKTVSHNSSRPQVSDQARNDTSSILLSKV